MKRISFLLIASIPGFVFAQLKQDIGLNSSWRGINYGNNQINLTGEYTFYIQKITAGIGTGVECWYDRDNIKGNSNTLMQKSYTGKIEPWTGFESNLFHSPIFISAKIGARFYFLNQVKDSISLYTFDTPANLVSASRKQVSGYSTSTYGNSSPSTISKYSYVTAMPFAFLSRINLGYAFNRIKISAFIMPYWVRFHYENAAFPERTGKTTIFFYDLGLGVNYTLPFKKEEKKNE